MQKGLHRFSKAASIGILSIVLRVHRLDRSFLFCQAFGIRYLNLKGQCRFKNLNLLSSPLSLATSKAVIDSNNSLPTKEMASDPFCSNNPVHQFSAWLPPPNEFSKLISEFTPLCNQTDTTKIVSRQTLNGACRVLCQFIQTSETVESDHGDNLNVHGSDKFAGSGSDVDFHDLHALLASYGSMAAERLCHIARITDQKDKLGKRSKKRTWEALQNAAGSLQNFPSAEINTLSAREISTTKVSLESNALAVCMVFGALSFIQQQQSHHGGENSRGAKAAASALSSTILRNNVLRQAGRPISTILLRSYIEHALCNKKRELYFELNILNHLARSFQLTDEHIDPSIVAGVVRETVKMADNGDEQDDLLKQALSGACAMACQLRPWSVLSPVELISVATAYDFYHSAEEICRSAYKAAKDFDDGHISEGNSTHQHSASKQEDNARYAVQKLIDVAIVSRLYRRADALATSLYQLGGRSRYVEARYLHACDTITRVISKRQFPIVDRQIDRVDKAIAKVESCDKEGIKRDDCKSNLNMNETIRESKVAREMNCVNEPSQQASENRLVSPSVEIREYAIQKFQEVGEIEAAERLAKIHKIDFVHDKEAALLAMALRQERYLQFDEVLRGEVPLLITKPDELISGFDKLLREDDTFLSQSTKQQKKQIGFDAEWDEETRGVALLQLASTETVLLIDILALSSAEEGVNALRETVGKLLSNPEFIVIGFACQQDLSRLRASPCVQVQQQLDEKDLRQHWVSKTSAVVDLQPLIGIAEASLRTTGLSRACEHFLGKPLDKSEQCSLWSNRPLTERQRSYASLDAWVCVGIYQKLIRLRRHGQELI